MLSGAYRMLGYARGLTLITYALIVFFASAAVVTSVSIAPARANSGFVVGDTGPGGGKIFYVDNNGFACGPDRSATCTYLEAAPSGWNTGSDPTRRWSQSTAYDQGSVVGARNDGIGWGFYNTRAIISAGNTDSASVAAALADAYAVTVSSVVYDDWYLPAKDELDQMRNQHVHLSMVSDRYWSSSEQTADKNNAWFREFNVSQDSYRNFQATYKNQSLYVRPVRAGQPAPSVTTFSSATSTPRNDSNATYNIVFSQSVTGLTSGDFENAGTATGCTFAVSGSGTTYTVTTSDCSDGTIQPRLKANSVTGSALNGPTSAATASTIITIDRVAPTATVTTATILATSNTSVQSSETGTAYLVNETVTITNLASITGAADNLWNSVAISTANTNTNLSASGLRSGTYKVYTVDAAGNLSAASTNTITIKPAAPGTPDLDAASDLGTSSTDNNTADDTPSFTVSSLETGAVVTLTATPASGSPVTCSFTATSASGSCTFTAMPNGTYAVTAVQVGSGISSDASTALSNVVINKTTISAGTPDLAADSDSGKNDAALEAFGVSNSDDITNDNTPTINVSGSSSGTRTVTAAKAGSSVSCTLSSGAYTCATAQSPLADGIWSITVTDTDSSGNSATSAALSVTIDTVPPAEFGGSYAERVIVPPGTNIQIQVPEAGSAQLRNQIASTNVKSALIPIAQADTSYTVQVPALNGTVIQIGQCYYLYAFDIAGNYRQSRNVVVCTAEAAAPTISNKSAPSGTYKFGQTLTNQMTVTGVPTPTVTYQYLRCTDSSNLNTCQDISGATSSTYTLTADDLGFKLGIRVTATNSQGSDTHTATSGSTITADSPGAPTSVSATITGETTASVSFTAPTFNGGSAITDYDLEYSSNNGSNWTSFNNGTSTANPILVTGLTKNTSYIFRVKAKNTAGDGSVSTASSAQTTFLAPTISGPTRPSSSIPADKVGSTLTNVMSVSGLPVPTISYQYVRCPSVSGNWVPTCVDIPGATTSTYILTAEDAGQHIGVEITATNSGGTTVQIGVATAKVEASVPGTPTSVTTTITGATTATVSFTAPTSTGGAAITGYTVTSTPTGAVCTVGANSTTYNCTGLTANTPYTFKVKATNTVGTGTDSVDSSPQTTEAVIGPISANVSVASRSLTASLPISTLVPITASGGAGPRTYSISPSLPSGLSLNTSTGAITGTPTGASASTSYTVSVTDGSSTSTATFSLGVNAALSSSAGSVPSGVYKDVAVTAFTPISFSGGTSPISYAVSPSLPAGLTLNTSTGVISGTATGTSANTTYTVTATDANGDTEASTFAFAVTDAPTTPDAPTIGAATSTGQTTATVAFTAPANTGGAAITTYTVTASPGGITATGSSSPITVTGLTAGTAYTFSITATNAGGLTSSSSSPSSSITTESAPAPSSGGGGGGGGSPAPEPDPEPSCNAACIAAQNAAAEKVAAEKVAAEKAAAEKVAAEKVAAEKVAAEKAAAVAVAEKTRVDLAAAAAIARAAVEIATAAASAKVEVENVAEAVSSVLSSANSSKADTAKITSDALASIESAPAVASKAARAKSADKAAETAASEVRAAAKAAEKAAKSTKTQELSNPEIVIGSQGAGSTSSQALSQANDVARAAKAAAKQVAATAATKASESKAAVETLQSDVDAAIAEVSAQQEIATTLALEAKNAAEIATAATAEKIAATSAAKSAAETLLALLTEKVTLAEQASNATTQEILLQVQQQIESVNLKIAEAEKTLQETSSKAELAIAAQSQAVTLAERTKASTEAQLAKVEELQTLLPSKTQAVVRAIKAAAVAEKVATAAKQAAAKIPSSAVIAREPGISTGKNSTRATISGLKPGQKVKVIVNVKPGGKP